MGTGGRKARTSLAGGAVLSGSMFCIGCRASCLVVVVTCVEVG